MSYHQSIQQSLLPQLTSARLAVRKRAIIALGREKTCTFSIELCCGCSFACMFIHQLRLMK